MKKILIGVLVFMSFNSLSLAENAIQKDLEMKFERVYAVLEILKTNIEHKEYYQAIFHVEANIALKTLNNIITEAEELMIIFKKNNDAQRYQEMKKVHDSYTENYKLLALLLQQHLRS